MSKVLALWLIVYFGGLAMALVHPIYPLVSYLTFYYMPPHVNWWGQFVPDLRFSLLAATVLMVSIFLKSSSLERVKAEKNPALPWLLLFGLNTIVVTFWALDRVRSWTWTVAFLKLILLYVLIPAAVRTPAHFDLFSAAHIGGATYWGYKAWDNPTREDSRLKDVGGPDTQNENQAAAHLLTVLPFVAVYALSVKRPIPKGIVLACGAFIVNVFILCNSRGATLALLAMMAAAMFLAGKGRRIKLASVGVGAIMCVLFLADDDFVRRQQTTTNPQDGAAQGRLVAWRAGIELIRDYPLGGGGRAFHILSPKYIPDIVEAHDGEERSVHNTYLHLGAEWGIQGLILWLGFIVSTFALLRTSRLRAQHDPWYFYRFLAIELALLGTLTAGVFGNRLYGESVYWMCALGVALRRMHATALAQEPAPAVETLKPVVFDHRRPATAGI